MPSVKPILGFWRLVRRKAPNQPKLNSSTHLIDNMYLNLTTVGICAGILYSVSTGYAWLYKKEIIEQSPELESLPTFELGAVLLYRGCLSSIGSMATVPLAIVNQLIKGTGKGITIIIDECKTIPEILQWIINSRFVRWVWNTITKIMQYFGHTLEPYFTILVRVAIYTVIGACFSLPVILVYSAFKYIIG